MLCLGVATAIVRTVLNLVILVALMVVAVHIRSLYRIRLLSHLLFRLPRLL